MLSSKAPPRLVKFSDLAFQPRQERPEMAQLAQISGDSDGSELGTGFARLSDARITWTVKYDEVITVIEGSLRVHTPTGILEAGPQDSIWLPQGTPLVYEAQSALIFYAIHPSHWASEPEQENA
ncbi:MAG: ethanolamine utilization protein EutQ [Burkholderiaceae bacterium]|nr:ethanolamine utilization protein EutQ [Burkholderiaceae bacterium]